MNDYWWGWIAMWILLTGSAQDDVWIAMIVLSKVNDDGWLAMLSFV